MAPFLLRASKAVSPRRTASFFAPDAAPGNAVASKIGSSEQQSRSHAF
jgi:hypothetical protein